MGYVALSRVRSLGGMKLLGFNDMSLEVDPEVFEKDLEFQKMSNNAKGSLEDLSRTEIEEKQKEWMRKIEPEEKIKIRKKAKTSLLNSFARSTEGGFREKANKEVKKTTHEITTTMLEEELPLADIADARGVKQETIVSHIEDLKTEGKCPDILYLKRELKRSEMEDIHKAFEKCKTTTLSPVFNYLIKQKKKTTYLKIRIARLFLEKN